MHRNVTAIYRTRETAGLVRRGLEEMGISPADIHVIPDKVQDVAGDRMTGRAGVGPAGTASAAAAPGAATAAGHERPLQGAGFLEDPAHSDRLHELYLPEEDLRTYQHAVRRGDCVVSVEVEDEDIERIKEIMRRPEEETYRLDDRDAEFSSETVVPHSGGVGNVIDEDLRARRTTSPYDPFARVYDRDAPLRNARRGT